MKHPLEKTKSKHRIDGKLFPSSHYVYATDRQ